MFFGLLCTVALCSRIEMYDLSFTMSWNLQSTCNLWFLCRLSSISKHFGENMLSFLKKLLNKIGLYTYFTSFTGADPIMVSRWFILTYKTWFIYSGRRRWFWWGRARKTLHGRLRWYWHRHTIRVHCIRWVALDYKLKYNKKEFCIL